MKKHLLAVILILMNVPSFTQNYYNNWGNKIGIRSNLLFPQNEFTNFGIFGNDDLSFKWFKFSHLFQAYYGYELSKSNELHLNAGYGAYKGRAYDKSKNVTNGEFDATIIPVDIRLRITPFDKPNWNPYFYIGLGIMHYEVTKSPDIPSPVNPKLKGWTGIYPIGVGAEFILSEKFVYDISFGAALSSSLDLDGYWGENNFLWDGYFNISIGVSWRDETCSSDNDYDGLAKCEELEIGTDNKNPDTDGDKIPDGDEVKKYKTNPLNQDSDSDSLSDYEEIFVFKTNPLSKDSDSDGINDNEEISVYLTNPSAPDTDEDNVNDYDEIFVYKTDPLLKDTDGDGLNDGEEIFNFKTDPLNTDTDGDKISDGDEIKIYHTNPLLSDTDSDALNDYDELFVYKTDPNLIDTDNGGIDDGTEIANESNPLNPKDDKKTELIEVGVPIVLEGITFEKNKYKIKPESEPVLWNAYQTLKNYPDMVVEISGHTDSDGSRKRNIELSVKRAQAVKDWLVQRGIESDRIKIKGYGPDRPVAPNDSRENKLKNRRIEFLRIQ